MFENRFKGTGEDSLDDILNKSRLGQDIELGIVDKETGEEVAKLNGAQLSFDFDSMDGDTVLIKEDSAGKAITVDDLMQAIDDVAPVWIFLDPVIFDKNTQAAFLDMPASERPRFIMEALETFYKNNIEYANFSKSKIYKDPLLLLEFFQSIKKSDFKKCGIKDNGRFNELQHRIKDAEIAIARTPINTKDLITIWPILSIREMFLESELAALYYLKNPKVTGAELTEMLEEIPAVYDLPSGSYLFAAADLMAHIAAQRDLYFEVTKGGRKKSDRHKQIIVKPLQNGYEITQKKKGETTITTVLNKDLIKSTAAMKLFVFLLVKANQQNFNPVITFSLQELVNIGMYSGINNARDGFKKHIAAVQSLQLAGEMKKGKRYIRQQGGVLFYNHEIENNIVKVSVNENFDIEYLTSYYTTLPSWAWSLSDNAFELLLYILMRARTERKETLNVSLQIIREKLALPTKEEYDEKGKKWKPKQYVKEPITAAVQNIVDVAKQNQDENISIEPHYVVNDKDLEEWLKGYINVKLSGEYSEKFKAIKGKQSKIIEANTRRKEEAIAAAEAKKEVGKNNSHT